MVHVGIFESFRRPMPTSIPPGRDIPDAPLIIAALFRLRRRAAGQIGYRTMVYQFFNWWPAIYHWHIAISFSNPASLLKTKKPSDWMVFLFGAASQICCSIVGHQLLSWFPAICHWHIALSFSNLIFLFKTKRPSERMAFLFWSC